MFPALNIDSGWINYIRHPTRYKKIKVLAKLDGTNWYDISDWVVSVKVNNQLEMFETPAIDKHSITVANYNHEWCPTSFNDVFDPAHGKFNGTQEQAYLNKIWEVKTSVEVEKSVLSFDGIDDQIPISWNQDMILNNFTMELWAKPTKTVEIHSESNSGVPNGTGYEKSLAIAETHGQSNDSCGAGLNLGINGLEVIEHTNSYYPSVLTYSTDLSGWHHITIVYENRTPKLYIDGVYIKTGLTGTKTYVFPGVSKSFTGYPGKIGAGVYGYFEGDISEVRLWNYARNETEIRNNMYKTLTGKENGLVAYYKFDTGSGNILKDYAGNNDGVIYGATWDTVSTEIPLFWGIKETLKEKKNTATINVADRGFSLTRKKLETDVFFTDKYPQEVLELLLQEAGFTSNDFDFQNITNDTFKVFYIAKRNKTYWQNIVDFVKTVNGRFSTTPEGKFIFRTRVDNESLTAEDTTAVNTLTEENFSNYQLDTKQKYNSCKVEAETLSIESTQKNVVEAELQGNNKVISPAKTAKFEFEYVSDFALNVSDFIVMYYSVGIMSGNEFIPTAIQEGISFYWNDQIIPEDNNIKIISYTKYADKVVLEIENKNTETYVAIDKIQIKGIRVFKAGTSKYIVKNETGEPDAEYSAKSSFVNQTALEEMKDAISDEIQKKVFLSANMNEFYPDFYAGNLVNIAVPTLGIGGSVFLVRGVNHTIEKGHWQTKLELMEWSINYVTTTAERKETIKALALIWTLSDLQEYLEKQETKQPNFGDIMFGTNVFGTDGR